MRSTPRRIDAHTHLFPPEQRRARDRLAAEDPTFAEMYGSAKAAMACSEELLGALDDAGFDAAFAAGFAFAAPREVSCQNEYLLATAAGSGGRIYALCTLNLAAPGWEEEAARCLSAGALGFGELRPHNQGWDPVGPASLRLCELAAEARAPLLWHVSEPVGRSYRGKHGGITPEELARLAELRPQTTMIAAHFGGGLPFYWQMPDLRTKLSNVYFDTAAGALLYDEKSVRRLIDLVGGERALFGSDFPLVHPRRELVRLGRLPAKAATALLGGNAERLVQERYRG